MVYSIYHLIMDVERYYVFFQVNPPEALKVFVPGVCRLLIALTDNEEIQNEEHLDDELLFNLLLLSEVIQSLSQLKALFILPVTCRPVCIIN